MQRQSSYKVHLNTICKRELLDPLCDKVKTLVILLDSPSPKDSLCQVWLKKAKWFCKRFLKVLNIFLLFPNYLPFEKGVALHWNKFVSTSPKNAFSQVWLKLDQLFWRRRFLKVVNLFLSFPNYMYLPFGKGVALHVNKLESPSPGDTLCQPWLKLAQWSWRRRRTKRRRTTCDQKSSLELSAQVS